jgi:kelch-like protein 2/3
VDATSLTLVIEYMYTGELLITECNVQSLLITANLLGMGNVKDSCGQFIQSQIDVTNCLGIYEFADYHCAKVLEKHADAFIEQYFSDIVQKEEFLSLNVDQIIKLISKDHLAVHSEKIVFDCVLKWINHDYEKRHSFLAKLMENVRFCLLKHDDLVQISEDPLVKANILCMEFIVEALQFKMIKSNSAELLKFEANFSKKSRLKPRVPLGLPKVSFFYMVRN